MSTTINSYSVALGLNADGLIDGSKLARGEAASLTRTLQSLATPTEQLASHINKMDNAFRKGGITASTHAEAVGRVAARYAQSAPGVDSFRQAVSRVDMMLKQGTIDVNAHAQAVARLKQHYAGMKPSDGGLAGVTNRLSSLAAGYIGVHAAANFASGAIRKSADIEKAAASYEVLTGSAEQAKGIITDVRDLASRGISLSALNQSAQTMLSFNVSAQTVVPTLRQIAEITGGDAERMQRLSLAFSQVAGNGRLMAEELNQMVEAGFNPLQEISRTTGVSIVDLRKQMADGAISFEMVQDAFASVTGEGGRFNGMLDKVSGTTQGSLNTIQATFENFQVSVGEALGPAIQSIAADFKDSAAAGGELAGIVSELTSLFVGLDEGIRSISGKGSLGTMIDGLKSLAPALNPLKSISSAIKDPFGTANALIDGKGIGAPKEVADAAGSQTPDANEPAKTPKLSDFDSAVQLSKAMAAMTPKEVTASYDRLQDSIKRAQSAVVPTLNNLQKEINQRERLSEITKEREDLEREADQIRRNAIDPAEKLAKSIADVARMQELGLLTGIEAERAKNDLLAEMGKDIKIEAPKAIDANSQAGADLIAEMQNRQLEARAKENAKALNMQQQMLIAQQEANRKLDKIAEVQPRNIR